MRFIATCKIGLESVVSLELKRLGIEVERVEDARVLFLGDYQTMAKACLWLRTAERVLMEVASFEARSFEELFQGVKAVSWRDYLKKDSFIHVNGKSAKSTLFSVSDCQRIAKKAIVEKPHGRVPNGAAARDRRRGDNRDRHIAGRGYCGAGLLRRGAFPTGLPHV